MIPDRPHQPVTVRAPPDASGPGHTDGPRRGRNEATGYVGRGLERETSEKTAEPSVARRQEVLATWGE